MLARVSLLCAALTAIACSESADVSESDSGAQPFDAGASDSSVELFDAPFQVIDAQAADATVQVMGCEPGLYKGTYSCEGSVLPDGPLEFQLEVNEKVVSGGPCTELCTDLIIKEGTGTLRGSWTVAAFEGQLQGGLDCDTGKFEAKIVDGIWGLPPGDPDGAVLAVDKFQATLQGSYLAAKPERIEGTWQIKPDIAVEGCVGEIRLQHQ